MEKIDQIIKNLLHILLLIVEVVIFKKSIIIFGVMWRVNIAKIVLYLYAGCHHASIN